MRAPLLTVLGLLTAVPMLASIRGTVMTTDGQAIAGARISIMSLEAPDARRSRLMSKSPDRPTLAIATSDSKGAFVLDSPKDPVVVLQVDAKGFAPDALRIEREEDGLVVALRSAPLKQGSVTANGKPVSGANVVWSAGSASYVATTDAAGHYTVPDPAKWAPSAAIIHPDFALAEEQFNTRRRTELNFSLDPGVPLSGKVVKGTTVVPKATILVDGWPLATSGDDGTFSVAHAPKGWEAVDARDGDFIATQTRGAGPLTLKMTAASTISGAVRDMKGQPVAGVEVSFNESMGRGIRASIASSVTDAKGAFNTTIRPGVYQIVSTHPAYSVEPMNVSAAAGQRVQKMLAATANAKIVGTVVDEQKRGVAAANVVVEPLSSGSGMFALRRLMMPGMRMGVFSGPDGRFMARTSDEGDVELTASKKGVPDGKSGTVRIASGDRKSGVTITMPLGVVFSGRVTDHNGQPLSGVAITTAEAESSNRRPGGPMLRRMVLNISQADADGVLTGSDGKFSMRVKEGTYDVKFSREGFAAKTVAGQQVTASSKPVEVTLEAGVEIAGRVVRSGKGIDGVFVSTISEARATTTTGPDGSFVLRDLTPGSYTVNLSKPDEFIQQIRTLSAPVRDVTIDVPVGGRISGRVVDKAGHQPVTTFQAGIDPSRAGGGIVMGFMPIMRKFTADDGSFVLENVPPGSVNLVVSAPGFTTAHPPTITVEEGKSVDNVEVALETGVRLAGRVSGPDGSPVPGVTVRPGGGGMRMPGIPSDTVAVTDANGDYAIDQLEGGDNKTFMFSRSGYLPEQKTTNLSGKETRLDVQLSTGLTITGQVVTEGGVPVGDADVRAMSAAAGSTPKNAKTDANGSFIFETVAPGRYTFSASKYGFADGVLRDFDVSGGGAPRVVLKSGGTLTGHVSGVADADLSRVTVNARGPNGSADAALDAGGNYRIDGAPTGTLRVSASLMRGFGDMRSTEAKTIEITPGGSAQLDLAFSSDIVIRGRVTRNGLPAANTTVQFMPRSATAQTRAGGSTDEAGNYSISGLAQGDYVVTVVDMQRLSPYTTNYSVHGSGTFDINIRTSTLRGRVIDRGDSSPIGGARIEIRSRDQQNSFMSTGATSDDSGSFSIDSVSAGTYSISAEKDGFGNVVKDITVGDSAPQDVMLDLVRNDGVALKVVDGRDGRALNAFIVVYDTQNRPVYESGRFGASESQRLPLGAGEYHAIVSASGYAQKSVSFMSPSSQVVSLTPGGTVVIRSRASATVRALLLDASGAPYLRPFAADPSIALPPGETRMQNVVPGQYTLKVLGPGGTTTATKTLVVVEGQESDVDI